MRAFVAIPLPAAERNALAAYTHGLDLAAARPVAASDLHVTVHFLGSVPDDRASPLADALALACSVVPHFTLRVRAAEPAPRGRPRLVWAALEAPEDFAALARSVAAAAAPFAPDARAARPGRPHVTLARLGRPPRRGAELPSLPQLDPIAVTECALMRSHLDRAGARYGRLARLPLRGPAPLRPAG